MAEETTDRGVDADEITEASTAESQAAASTVDDTLANITGPRSKAPLVGACAVILVAVLIGLGVQLMSGTAETAPVEDEYTVSNRAMEWPKTAPTESPTEPMDRKHQASPAGEPDPTPGGSDESPHRDKPNTPPDTATTNDKPDDRQKPESNNRHDNPEPQWWDNTEARKKSEAERLRRRTASSVKYATKLELEPANSMTYSPGWEAKRAQAREDAITQALAGTRTQTDQSEDDLSTHLAFKPPDTVTAQWRPDVGFLLSQGKTLTCTLETAIQSDLPGMTRCLINHDVYSDNGQHMLVPRGSTAIGEYSSGMKQGVNRIFVIWTRLRTPHGLDVQLASPATGELGESGLHADIDGHFMARFGASALLSIIGGLAATQSDGNGDRYAETANSFSESASIALDNSINIRPTGHILQGSKIIIMVAQDLDFGPAMTLQRTVHSRRHNGEKHE